MSLLIKRFDQMVKLGGFDVNADGPAAIRDALLKIEATEALATEAGKALVMVEATYIPRASCLPSQARLAHHDARDQVEGILAKLSAAGLLPAAQEERGG